MYEESGEFCNFDHPPEFCDDAVSVSNAPDPKDPSSSLLAPVGSPVESVVISDASCPVDPSGAHLEPQEVWRIEMRGKDRGADTSASSSEQISLPAVQRQAAVGVDTDKDDEDLSEDMASSEAQQAIMVVVRKAAADAEEGRRRKVATLEL